MWLAVAIYTVVYGFFLIQRYRTSYLGDADFGIGNQMFWTTLHGFGFFRDTMEECGHFGTHNTAVFILLLPFYWIWPSIYCLLILQTAAVAAGAVPVYLLGRHFLDARCGLVLSISYLLYHPLHGVSYDQFNELGFAVAPLLFAFYGLYCRRWMWMWTGLLVTMSCKEDMSIVTFMFGVYMLVLARSQGSNKGTLRHTLVKQSLVLMAVSASWFLCTLTVLFPYFRMGQEWPYFKDRYGYLGSSLGEVVKNMLLHPWVVLEHLFSKKALTLIVELLVPLTFLPLRAPAILMVPSLVWVTLMLSTFAGTQNAGSRYQASIIACLFAATVVGLRRTLAPDNIFEPRPLDPAQRQKAHERVTWVLVLTLLMTLFFDTTPMRFPFRNIPFMTEHQRKAYGLIELIPDTASVSTQAEFYGRLSARPHAHVGYLESCDYILVDPTVEQWYASAAWPQTLPSLLSSGMYRLLREADGAQLYVRSDRNR